MPDNANPLVTLTAADTDAGNPENLDGSPSLVISDNTESSTYEAYLGDQLAAGAAYGKTGDHVTVYATSVLPEFRGQGIATQLVGGVLDLVKSQGKTVTIACPFASRLVSSFPQHADIIA